MTSDEEIIALTTKWYHYVNIDHHKDRDCHFDIGKSYSYGNPAKFYVSHSGYIDDGFFDGPFDSLEDAEMMLISRLTRMINRAIKHLEGSESASEEELEWMGLTRQKARDMLSLLKGDGNGE